jgi:glutamate dehydrogenase (NADP+)
VGKFDCTARGLLATMLPGYDCTPKVADEFEAPDDYVAGANIAGFLRVGDAMLALGVI